MDWKELTQQLITDINELIPECGLKLAKCKAFLANLELQKKALTDKLDYLSQYDDDAIQTTAWCADYSLDLSGVDHGSLEIAREWEKGINIQPGYEGASVYDKTRDGILQYPIGNFPITAFYNWAIFPGVQIHRPIYRYGTLTNIDYENNTGTVTLEAVQSKALHLPVNNIDYQVLNTVPITYMSCHAAAFSENDSVIVRFEDKKDMKFPWRNPTIIGFKDHPKPCERLLFQLFCECKPDILFTLENVIFLVLNSSLGEISYSVVWDDVAEAFWVKIDEEYQDENGYWISYQSEECAGKLTQYPGIWNESAFYQSQHLVLPSLEVYQDTMPCFWEHWLGTGICETRDWYVYYFHWYNVEGVDQGSSSPYTLCAVNDFYAISGSYFNVQMSGDEPLQQKVLGFYHEFETPFAVNGCRICLRNINVFCPDERDYRTIPYNFMRMGFFTESSTIHWYIFRPDYRWSVTTPSIWEDQPLPPPDENGNVILTLNFGIRLLTYVNCYVSFSNKIEGQNNANMEFKIDWIDFY